MKRGRPRVIVFSLYALAAMFASILAFFSRETNKLAGHLPRVDRIVRFATGVSNHA